MQLRTHQLSGPRAGPYLLIFGAVHGDEFEGPAAIERLVREIPRERVRGRVTLVPVVNESAYAACRRTGDDGLDLARTFPGRADGTLTERVAQAANALIADADFLIDLHSGGSAFRVWPLVGYMLHPDARVLDTQRRMALAFGLPFVWGTSAKLAGRSLSAARDAGKPAIYAEWLGGGACDPVGVAAYVQGCLGVLRALEMLDAAESPPSPAPLVVEDDAPASGHLQTDCPAPFTGFFEPAIELGARVVAGQTLGRVIDPLGGRAPRILAPRAGLMVTLRWQARVAEGESVGCVAAMP